MIYDKGECLDDLQEVVDRVTVDLQKHADKFDFIAVRGCSGLVVGAPVSLAIGKPLVIVRKETENNHGWGVGRVFANQKHARGRYLFLDDIISSGATRRAVQNAFTEHYPGTTEYVGSYLYQYADHPFMWAPSTATEAA